MTDPVAEAAAQIAAQQSVAANNPQAAEVGTATVGEQSSSLSSGDSGSGEQENADRARAADLPNAASDAAEPTVGLVSAPNADGAGIAASNAASSGEPLHVRIAAHLEAIFQIAKDAPAAAVTNTSALKTHIGDILHRISNGIAVTEGELVQKLEALYHML